MIHKFEMNGVRLVLDVHSGAVHIIDELIWDLLDYGPNFPLNEVVSALKDKYKPEALEEGIKELRQLTESEMLYTSWNQEDNLS